MPGITPPLPSRAKLHGVPWRMAPSQSSMWRFWAILTRLGSGNCKPTSRCRQAGGSVRLPHSMWVDLFNGKKHD